MKLGGQALFVNNALPLLSIVQAKRGAAPVGKYKRKGCSRIYRTGSHHKKISSSETQNDRQDDQCGMTIPVQFVQTYLKVGVLQAFSQRGVWVSLGHPIADFGHPKYPYFLCIMQYG